MDAFDILKNDGRTNARDRLQDTPLISYGFVTKVHAATLVDVEAAVQESAKEKECYTVRLLSPASLLLESYTEPVPGDLVLLLFMRRFNPAMFTPPSELRAASGMDGILDPEARGYHIFSGVGILFAAFRDYAATQLKYFIDGDGTPGVQARTSARAAAYFGRSFDAVFDRDEGVDGDGLVSAVFGGHSPFTLRHRAAVLREYGFQKAADGALSALDAPVEEKFSIYSPVTRNIQGRQTVIVGIGEDADGNPEETDAPVAETYGSKAPITRKIRAGQTIIIGVAEDGGDTDAPVSVTLGGDADITLTSKSGLSITFDKPVSIKTKDSFSLTLDGAEKIYIGNSANDIKTLLHDLVDQIERLKTFGSPGAHTVDPSSILALETFKETGIDALFE
jgi:hypothetical protein